MTGNNAAESDGGDYLGSDANTLRTLGERTTGVTAIASRQMGIKESSFHTYIHTYTHARYLIRTAWPQRSRRVSRKPGKRRDCATRARYAANIFQ